MALEALLNVNPRKSSDIKDINKLSDKLWPLLEKRVVYKIDIAIADARRGA